MTSLAITSALKRPAYIAVWNKPCAELRHWGYVYVCVLQVCYRLIIWTKAEWDNTETRTLPPPLADNKAEYCCRTIYHYSLFISIYTYIYLYRYLICCNIIWKQGHTMQHLTSTSFFPTPYPYLHLPPFLFHLSSFSHSLCRTVPTSKLGTWWIQQLLSYDSAEQKLSRASRTCTWRGFVQFVGTSVIAKGEHRLQ